MTEGLPVYATAILSALRSGDYRVDPDLGIIYGMRGRPLSVRRHGSQRYPTVPLVVRGMPRRAYSVPAHKVVAAALWGSAAFAPGVHVRHGRGGVLDITRGNLTLGSPSDNEKDKDPEVRSRVGRAARSFQSNLVNAKLSWEQVRALREEHRRLRITHPRKLPPGSMRDLEKRYGVSKTNITDIVKGRTWKE